MPFITAYRNINGEKTAYFKYNLENHAAYDNPNDPLNTAPTVSIVSASKPVGTPTNPTGVGGDSDLIANTTNVTSAFQITVKFNGAVVAFNFDVATGVITATETVIAGVNTWEVIVTTPDGSATDTASFTI